MTIKALAPAAILLLAFPLATRAQTAQAAAQPADETLSPLEQSIHDLKNPLAWMNWGGDLRIRNEYFNNGVSLGSNPNLTTGFPVPGFPQVHEQDYFRIRGRLWTSITPTEGLSLNVRLAAEPRDFMNPSTMDTYYDREGMQWRYGIIDNLNVQWKQPANLPLTLTVGRQEIFLGDGWLVGDGTPNDGSFTMFFDAARATLDLKDQNTTIDAIGLFEYARPDAWLPTLGASTSATAPGSEPLSMTDQNEKGAILWINNKSLPAANLDAYFIYKHDGRVNDAPSLAFGDDADIYTLGGRVSGPLADHWQYSAEGAYQFGQKQDPSSMLSTARPAVTAT